MAVHRIRPGTFADGLLAMTDAEYAAEVDTSPSIGDAYCAVGKVRGSSTHSACKYASVFGIKSRISGATKGDPPTISERRKR